jgi:hypothetical protein
MHQGQNDGQNVCVRMERMGTLTGPTSSPLYTLVTAVNAAG